MSLQPGSPSGGASGISLGSTVPHLDPVVQSLERQVAVRQEEIDTLKQKLQSLEADILIKHEALSRIAVLEQENHLLKKIATEKEKWREQANELCLENDRLKQMKDDLVLQNLRQRQTIAEHEEKMALMARMLDLMNTELNQEKENKHRLKRKLQILSSPEETPERRGRFKRQSLRDCSRCHAEITTTAVCRFHPKQPVKLNGSFHFPCCGKSGKSEPEGCRREGQHTVLFAS